MNASRHFPAAIPAIAGVLFAALLFAGYAAVDPIREGTDEQVLAWWSDSGNVENQALSMYLIFASAAAFAVFLVGLRSRLAAAEGGTAPLATLVTVFGLIFVTTLVAGDALRGGVAHSVRYEDEILPGAGILRTVTSLSFTLMGIAAFGAVGLMLATASYAILRTGAMAAWLGWAGAAVSVVVLLAVPFLVGPWTAPLLQLWTVAACVELWRTRNRAAVPQPQALAASPA